MEVAKKVTCWLHCGRAIHCSVSCSHQGLDPFSHKTRASLTWLRAGPSTELVWGLASHSGQSQESLHTQGLKRDSGEEGAQGRRWALGEDSGHAAPGLAASFLPPKQAEAQGPGQLFCHQLHQPSTQKVIAITGRI